MPEEMFVMMLGQAIRSKFPIKKTGEEIAETILNLTSKIEFIKVFIGKDGSIAIQIMPIKEENEDDATT